MDELRRKYEEPLDLFARVDKTSAKRQTVVLEFLRDEDAKVFERSYPFKFEQNRLRKIVIGNGRLKTPQMEKNGAYEIVAKVSLIVFNVFNWLTERGQVL